uniref:TetR/AcrR family transcriptional regulator n=1 Tax=Nonomuraea pusilla TaxID=46177 RepID=UPI0006E3B8A0|nr:TetR/AcrR family transcriptional regulator [Nonomuraea pusilla]
MPRQTQQQIDDEIIDVAAALFARHGLKETSVQRIADAVGYSKSGLLRRYPSKEALQDEVVARCLAEVRGIAGAVAGLAPGPSRDREALVRLAALAVRHPGFVALILSGVSHSDADADGGAATRAATRAAGSIAAGAAQGAAMPPAAQETARSGTGREDTGSGASLGLIADALADAFAVTPETGFARRARVTGALGALAVVCVAMRGRLPHDAARHLVDVAYDALGHARTEGESAAPPMSRQDVPTQERRKP